MPPPIPFSAFPPPGPWKAPGIGGDGPAILATTWPQVALGIVMVGLRCIYAGKRNNKWSWDCFWAVVALVIGILAQISLTIGVHLGLGQHIQSLGSFQQAARAVFIYWVSAVAVLYAITFAKIAIVSLLLSVWCPWQTKRRYFLHFIWVTNLLAAVILSGLAFTQCSPSRRTWDYSVITGNCDIRPKALQFAYFHGAWSVWTDLALAIYPVLIIRDIKANFRTKLGFCVLMSGGFLSAVASFLRTWYLHETAVNIDTTVVAEGSAICGFTELWLIIILGCIPPLKPLWLRLLQNFRGSQSLPSDPAELGTAVPTIEVAPVAFRANVDVIFGGLHGGGLAGKGDTTNALGLSGIA